MRICRPQSDLHRARNTIKTQPRTVWRLTRSLNLPQRHKKSLRQDFITVESAWGQWNFLSSSIMRQQWKYSNKEIYWESEITQLRHRGLSCVCIIKLSDLFINIITAIGDNLSCKSLDSSNLTSFDLVPIPQSLDTLWSRFRRSSLQHCLVPFLFHLCNSC